MLRADIFIFWQLCLVQLKSKLKFSPSSSSAGFSGSENSIITASHAMLLQNGTYLSLYTQGEFLILYPGICIIYIYRNLYAVDYKKLHPLMSTAEYGKVWDTVDASTKQVSTLFMHILLLILFICRSTN